MKLLPGGVEAQQVASGAQPHGTVSGRAAIAVVRIVGAPLPDIAMHVMQAECIRLKRADVDEARCWLWS